MTDNEHSDFRRKIIGERILLMLPLNVVLTGRVRGSINVSEVTVVLEQLRSRHPLLAVRAEIGSDGAGAFVGSGVPSIPVHVQQRESEDQWLARVKDELRISFPIETGPLVRCSVIHSDEVCEIILCGHHTICDGKSLGYLLRDLLERLAAPSEEIGDPMIPPPIDRSTVAMPPSTNALLRFIMGLINRKWDAKGIRFSESDMFQMHEKYWKQNTELQLLSWSLDASATATLVDRSRAEDVTVNSALWTAFLAAQHDVQIDRLL